MRSTWSNWVYACAAVLRVIVGQNLVTRLDSTAYGSAILVRTEGAIVICGAFFSVFATAIVNFLVILFRRH